MSSHDVDDSVIDSVIMIVDTSLCEDFLSGVVHTISALSLTATRSRGVFKSTINEPALSFSLPFRLKDPGSPVEVCMCMYVHARR